MICGKCCGEEPVRPTRALWPCCFTNQSRIRITWQLIDYGNEQERCCCTDPAFMGNTIEIPFNCSAWNPPYCPGCGHSGTDRWHPQPNCESNTINGPRWQGYGIVPAGRMRAAVTSTPWSLPVATATAPRGWYVTVGWLSANEGFGRHLRTQSFAACIPIRSRNPRKLPQRIDPQRRTGHNHSICTNVWNVSTTTPPASNCKSKSSTKRPAWTTKATASSATPMATALAPPEVPPPEFSPRCYSPSSGIHSRSYSYAHRLHHHTSIHLPSMRTRR